MTPRQLIDTALLGLALTFGSVHAHALPVLERVLDQPCRAIALDREPYVAALGNDSVTVFDKRGSHQEALPEALRGKDVNVGIFFGRDYRVRIAGSARTQKGDEVRYYRSLPSGIKSALDEIGPIGKPGSPGIVALLGTADPEIVCRVGESCLIKRISGWAKASAPPGLTRVGLSLGTGWAIAGTSFYTLGKDWQALPAAGPWRKADDAFVRGAEACVLEHDASKMHHFDGTAWHSASAPVTGPRSVWGSQESLWIGGDGGAAVFDEGAFRKLDGALHVAQVLGRAPGDVWVCAAEGVFRAR